MKFLIYAFIYSSSVWTHHLFSSINYKSLLSLFWSSNCQGLANWSPSKWLLYPLVPHHSLSLSLLCVIRCPKLICTFLSLDLNHPSYKKSMFPSEWYLEVKTWVLGVLTPFRVACSQDHSFTFLVERAKESLEYMYMHMCICVCVHIYFHLHTFN